MSQRIGMAAAAAAESWRRLQWLMELCWVNSTELRSQTISVAAWCNLPFRRVPSRTWLSTEMRWDEMSWPCKLFPGARISRLIAIGYIMSISHRAAGGYSRTHIGQISLTESLRRYLYYAAPLSFIDRTVYRASVSPRCRCFCVLWHNGAQCFSWWYFCILLTNYNID